MSLAYLDSDTSQNMFGFLLPIQCFNRVRRGEEAKAAERWVAAPCPELITLLGSPNTLPSSKRSLLLQI